jgi:hypothetical protein
MNGDLFSGYVDGKRLSDPWGRPVINVDGVCNAGICL